MMDFFRKLVPTELFRGMAVTGGYFFKRKETVQRLECSASPVEATSIDVDGKGGQR